MIVGKGGGLVTVEKVKNEGKEMKLGKEREKIAYNRSGKGKKSQFCFFGGGVDDRNAQYLSLLHIFSKFVCKIKAIVSDDVLSIFGILSNFCSYILLAEH